MGSGTRLFRRAALIMEGHGQRQDTVQGSGDGMGRLEPTGLMRNLLFFRTSAPGKSGSPGAQRRHRLPSDSDSLYFFMTGAPRTLPRSLSLLSGCCLYSPSVQYLGITWTSFRVLDLCITLPPIHFHTLFN